MRGMAAARAMLTTPRCLPVAALAIKQFLEAHHFHFVFLIAFKRRAKSLALRNVLVGSSAFGLLTIDIHTSTGTFF